MVVVEDEADVFDVKVVVVSFVTDVSAVAEFLDTFTGEVIRPIVEFIVEDCITGNGDSVDVEGFADAFSGLIEEVVVIEKMFSLKEFFFLVITFISLSDLVVIVELVMSGTKVIALAAIVVTAAVAFLVIADRLVWRYLNVGCWAC